MRIIVTRTSKIVLFNMYVVYSSLLAVVLFTRHPQNKYILDFRILQSVLR